jgi:cell wall-associated NlpC family hydrolase
LISNRRFVSGAVIATFTFFGLGVESFAQERPRVVRSVSSRPVNQPPPSQPSPTSTDSSTPHPSAAVRQPLTTRIEVQPPPPLVKKTGDSSPLNAMNKAAARRSLFPASVSNELLSGIQARIGIPYRYGSQGPNTYDCSGFIWSVFRDAGLEFERASARTMWANSTPVEGDERFVFGTLVFMNKLGHVGIVADENGFYHASRSKGITYSPFKGYWKNRIDGFRRLNLPGAIMN